MLEHGINVDSLQRHMAFMTYESHVLFALRFMIDCDLVGGNWVELKAGAYSLLNLEVHTPTVSVFHPCNLMCLACKTSSALVDRGSKYPDEMKATMLFSRVMRRPYTACFTAVLRVSQLGVDE